MVIEGEIVGGRKNNKGDQMEKRKFTICIDNYWSISPKDRQKDDMGELEPNDIFLRLYTKEGRIHILYDASISFVQDMAEIKDDMRLKEQCLFEVENGYTKKIVHKFEGDFIDALLYVRRNFYIFQYDEGVANSLPKWLRDELEAEAK
ncbi:hypothetical protein FACS189487_02700 [Campylobacterota bacterium]|nr:hypothetical protein FACS189487_02700 [Campylobacterota bacterium]